jgi:hypothetical protein
MRKLVTLKLSQRENQICTLILSQRENQLSYDWVNLKYFHHPFNTICGFERRMASWTWKVLLHVEHWRKKLVGIKLLLRIPILPTVFSILQNLCSSPQSLFYHRGKVAGLAYWRKGLVFYTSIHTLCSIASSEAILKSIHKNAGRTFFNYWLLWCSVCIFKANYG